MFNYRESVQYPSLGAKERVLFCSLMQPSLHPAAQVQHYLTRTVYSSQGELLSRVLGAFAPPQTLITVEVSLTLNFEKKDYCHFQKALGLLMQIIPNHYHSIMHTKRKGRLSKWRRPLKVTRIKNVFTSSVLSQNIAKMVLKIHLQKQGDRRGENCNQTWMPESGWQSCNWGRK